MRITKPSVMLKFPTSKETVDEMLMLVENSARLCYKSKGKMGDTVDDVFLLSLIDRGHLSVIEHSLVTFQIVCDRGVSHELVRHRLASYSQESTRYCNYANAKFGKEITVIKPCFFNEDQFSMWAKAMRNAEQSYFELVESGAPAQEARSVLPNSLKTEIVVSMNFRELRHFLKLRTSKAAHPQMREVASMMLKELKRVFPAMFNDIQEGQ